MFKNKHTSKINKCVNMLLRTELVAKTCLPLHHAELKLLIAAGPRKHRGTTWMVSEGIQETKGTDTLLQIEREPKEP